MQQINQTIGVNTRLQLRQSREKVLFSNEQNFSTHPGDVTVYPEGIPVIKVKLFKVKMGEQRKEMFKDALRLKAINPEISLEYLTLHLQYINKKRCLNPLSEDKIASIAKSVHEKPYKNRSYRIRKIIFDNDHKFTKKQFNKKLGEERGKLRHNKTKAMFISVIKKLAEEGETNITQEKVRVKSGRSERNVKTYWAEIKGEIDKCLLDNKPILEMAGI